MSVIHQNKQLIAVINEAQDALGEILDRFTEYGNIDNVRDTYLLESARTALALCKKVTKDEPFFENTNEQYSVADPMWVISLDPEDFENAGFADPTDEDFNAVAQIIRDEYGFEAIQSAIVHHFQNK